LPATPVAMLPKRAKRPRRLLGTAELLWVGVVLRTMGAKNQLRGWCAGVVQRVLRRMG